MPSSRLLSGKITLSLLSSIAYIFGGFLLLLGLARSSGPMTFDQFKRPIRARITDFREMILSLKRGYAKSGLPKWSLPTALAFLAWFVFVPQCLSTFAIIKKETDSWKWPLFAFGYRFVLAYVAAGITYHSARAFGL